MFIAPRIHAHIAVFGLEGADRHADRFGNAALQVRFNHGSLLQGERAFQQAGFDVRTAAFRRFPVERGRDCLQCIKARREIDRQHFNALWDARRAAIDRHHSRIGLHYRVRRRLIATRAFRTETGDAEVDDIGIGLFHAIVVERELVNLADAIVLDKNIALLRESLDDRHALIGLEIYGERPLRAIDDD